MQVHHALDHRSRCSQSRDASPAAPPTAQTDAIPSRLSLADAVRLAEQRNPTLDAARQQVLVADADTAGAKRWPNPLASVQSAGYNGQSTPYGFWDRQELTIQVEQEFELGDRRRLRGEAAGAAAGRHPVRARQSVRGSSGSTCSASTSSWCWRGSMPSRPRASLAEIDQVIAVNRSRYQQGEVSGGELRRLEVERLKFSEDALQAELATRQLAQRAAGAARGAEARSAAGADRRA